MKAGVPIWEASEFLSMSEETLIRVSMPTIIQISLKGRRTSLDAVLLWRGMARNSGRFLHRSAQICTDIARKSAIVHAVRCAPKAEVTGAPVLVALPA
jgi:hypothetical protein